MQQHIACFGEAAAFGQEHTQFIRRSAVTRVQFECDAEHHHRLWQAQERRFGLLVFEYGVDACENVERFGRRHVSSAGLRQLFLRIGHVALLRRHGGQPVYVFVPQYGRAVTANGQFQVDGRGEPRTARSQIPRFLKRTQRKRERIAVAPSAFAFIERLSNRLQGLQDFGAGGEAGTTCHQALCFAQTHFDAMRCRHDVLIGHRSGRRRLRFRC